jgi:RNA polymerase sigma factor (sigma-70 family)
MSNLNFVNGGGISSAQWNLILSKTNQAIRSYKQFSAMDKNEIAVEGYFKFICSNYSNEEFGSKRFWGYFLQIVKNISIDKVRKIKRDYGHFYDIDDSVELHMYREGLNTNEEYKEEQKKLMNRAMQELTERDKDLIIKKYYCGWSYKDIAEHFNYKNSNCAGNYVKRAMDRLRKIINKLKKS